MSYHQWVTVYSPAQISLIDCIQTHSDLILGCISKCQGLVSETALYGLLSHVKSKFKSLCAVLCLGLIRKQLNEKITLLSTWPTGMHESDRSVVAKKSKIFLYNDL